MPTRRSGRRRHSPADGSPFHGRIADNVVPQIDVLDDEGWSGEERKIMAELRKILELPDLDVSATAVRVPVHTGHSVALHVRTSARSPVAGRDGGARPPRRGSNIGTPLAAIATPCRSTSSAATPSWSAGCVPSRGASAGWRCSSSSDNLRKGAALNAIQVAACADPDRFGRLSPRPADPLPGHRLHCLRRSIHCV